MSRDSCAVRIAELITEIHQRSFNLAAIKPPVDLDHIKEEARIIKRLADELETKTFALQIYNTQH